MERVLLRLKSGAALYPVVVLIVLAAPGVASPSRIWVPYAESPPLVFDGRLEPSEWDEAGTYDVSDLAGFCDPPDSAGSVIMHASHDASFLRLAIVNTSDSMLSYGDRAILWIDDNNNDTLDPLAEGYYLLEHSPGRDLITYFPHLGIPFPTGFQIAMGDADGPVVLEAAVPLGSVDYFIDCGTGASFGAWLGVLGAEEPNLKGVWPPFGGSELVGYYGDVYLADSDETAPPGPPDRVSVTVVRPESVVVEWDSPVLDLAGDSLAEVDSLRIYRNGMRILSLPAPGVGVHGSYVDAGLALARGYSYRLSSVVVASGEGMESPLTSAEYALPGYLYYGSDFEADCGGWTALGPSDTTWQWGAPANVGPGRAYSGERCWGTGIAGPYGSGVRGWLVSPDVFVGSFPVSRSTLGFYHYYWTETWFDGGNVKVSRDGGSTWSLILPDSGYPVSGVSGLGGEPGYSGISGGWVYSLFDLSDYLGDTVKIMLDFGSDGSTEFAGWYVDNPVIVANGPGVGLVEERISRKEGLGSFQLEVAPNPSGGPVKVDFVLDREADADLSIFDVAGRTVVTLYKGDCKAGFHSMVWDATDRTCGRVPSGVYFCRLNSGVGFLTEKLIITR